MSGRFATLLSLLVVALAGAAYAGSLPGGFVYDDVRFVERNPAVQSGAPLAAYFLDPSTQTGDASWQGLWRPLRTLSFRAVHLVDAGPGPQRIANLLVHVANGMLVFLLLRRLFGPERGLPALIGAVAFVLHPLAAEPVAWISGRGDLLALTGMLGAVLLHDHGGRLATAAGLAAFALALLAKESAAALPLLLVATDGFRGGWGRVRRRLPAVAAYAVVLGLWVWARAAVLGAAFDQEGGRALSEDVLAVSLLGGGFYYVWTLLLPAGLTFELQLPTGLEAPWLPVAGLVVGAALAVGAWRWRRRTPVLTLAVLWFGAALLPVTALQLLFPLKILVANRFAYPALVAGGIALAWIATRGPRYAALAAVAVLAFVPMTVARADTFRTPRSLWTSVLAHDPENLVARYGRGAERVRAGEWRGAVEDLEDLLRRDPRHADAMAMLGMVYENLALAAPERQTVDQERAIYWFHRAIRTWQRAGEGRGSLYATALVHAAALAPLVGRMELAVTDVRILLRDAPVFPADPGAREGIRRRLGVLSDEFERQGLADLAGRLRALRDDLRGKERP